MIHSIEDNQKHFDNLMLVLTILLVFIMAVRTPLDSDMWWHLKAGEWMVNFGSPLLMDVFSYTRAGEVWINHSWLGEVILYWFYKNAGFWGLGFCVALTATASMGLLYKIMRGGPLFKAWFVILAAIICSFVWSPRPQIFSLLMFVALLSLIPTLSNQHGFIGSFGLFIFFILWSNLHGGYGLGILLLIFLLVGEILDFLARPDYKGKQIGGLKQKFIWLMIALVGVVINPNGLNTLVIPFKTIGVQTLQSLIDEWSSPNFHQLEMQPFLILFFIVVAAFAFSKQTIRGCDVIAFLGFAYLALVSKRNIAPFAIIASFIAGQYLPEILTEVAKNIREKLSLNPQRRIVNRGVISARLRRAMNYLLVGLLGLVALGKWYYVTHPVIVNAYESHFYPKKAITHIKKMGLPHSRLFNSYGWGGYTIWHLPEAAVFVDGRTDLFGDEILGEWLQVINAGKDWEQIVDKWEIGWFLIEPDQPVVERLIEKGWKVFYQDEVCIVIVRNNDQTDQESWLNHIAYKSSRRS
ncbi:MAG: hypothetical protein AB1457_03065 [Chloroflexota bacterium]|nr:MAG: hypothetical protein KatS3mg047_0949 [Bellilinea sp.]